MQVRKRFAHTHQRRLSGVLLLLCMLPLLPLLHAQKIALENYTAKTGLPQNTVNDIVQDHQGYLWLATQAGATRFDGYEFKLPDVDGLPEGLVNCLLVDRQGSIWMGSQKGIAVYRNNAIEIINTSHGLIDNRVDGMIEDLDGNIWAWTAYGISVITADTVLNYSRDNGLTGNDIVDALVDSRGKVHFATFKGGMGTTVFTDPYSMEPTPRDEILRDILEVRPGEIWYASQGSGILVNRDGQEFWLGAEQGLDDEITLCLMKDSKDRVWCGTYNSGLYVYEGERFRRVKNPEGAEPMAEEITEDHYGRIWIRDYMGGVWMLDTGVFNHFTKTSTLLDDDVLVMFEDSFGSIWMGTPSGLSKFGKNIFEIYDEDMEGLSDNHIYSVFVDSREQVWFGANSELCRIRDGAPYTVDVDFGNDSLDRKIISFAEDKDHVIYVGTDTKLFSFNGKTGKEELNLGQSRKKQITINSLLYTTDEQLWCATDSGIYIYNPQTGNAKKVEQGLIRPEVNALMQMDDAICCATEGGLSFFDFEGKHLRNFTEADGLISDICLDVIMDFRGNIYVATDNMGICKISMGSEQQVERFTVSDGLVSNNTSFLEFRDSLSLWIGTNKGINVLNIATGEISLYGDEEGFYPLESFVRSISKGQDGDLWIGTLEGLVHYNPRYDIKQMDPPILTLFPPMENDSMIWGGEGRSGFAGSFPAEVTAPYKNNSLTFSFTGIHTTSPSRNTFSWYLEGADKGWSIPSTERKVSYQRLPSGHYTFRLKAFNLDGVETKEEASFAFTIRPPFWKTLWFIILDVIAALAMIYGVFKYRERQLIKEKRILEHKVKVRTQAIEDQKVEIEAQRDEISEQKSYVEEQRDQIIGQNKEITDSIQYASRIQQAVLPGKLTLKNTLPDHFVFFKPRDIVSGDFYWVESKNDQVVVCAADCTGHGVPGAFMSLLGLTFLNEIVNHDGVLKASEILNRLRKNIIRSMSHKDEVDQAKDGMDLSLVVIDRQLGMLEFSGAYNPLILVRKGELIEYKGDKMPVGKHIVEEKPFTNNKIQLEHNDMLYLFSDGFPDQFGGEKGGKYKARPFKQLLTRISTETVNKQHSILEAELKEWMGREPQVDDILIIGIRYMK